MKDRSVRGDVRLLIKVNLKTKQQTRAVKRDTKHISLLQDLKDKGRRRNILRNPTKHPEHYHKY